MFHQGWLKAYMLSNSAAADEKSGVAPAPPPVRPPLEKPITMPEMRVPDLGDLGNARVGDESARLGERTGLSNRSNLPSNRSKGGYPGPGVMPSIAEPNYRSTGSKAPAPQASPTPCAGASRASPMSYPQYGSQQPQEDGNSPGSRTGSKYGSKLGSKPTTGAMAMGGSKQTNYSYAENQTAASVPAPFSPPWQTNMQSMGNALYGQPGAGLFGGAPMDQTMGMFNYSEGGGLKNYVVMCKDDVEVRASPTYADDSRIGHFLHPGQVVVIDDRRMVTGSWFLHLADGRGWVFETKERLLVMTEAKEFERGLWHYSVCCDDEVETRICPTYSDDARTGCILGPGDCIACDERCNVAGARFLKLADGRGWVFETKDRLLVMSEVRAKAVEARDFARGLWHYTVVCDDDVEIRAAPTYSDEARTGLMVHPGDCVAVDERCRVAAVWFLRLADGRGWVFESKDSRRVMMQLH